MNTAIELRGVTKKFGDVVAVNNIDLAIQQGEIVALLGPNGAGKTTALDMVLGLTSPSSGTVKVLGTNPSEAVRAGQISALLQTGGLLQDMKVGETVEYIASTFDQPVDTESAIKRAGIDKILGRTIKKCSGGEQQKLKFALALLTKPEILILDEPTAGMDVGARRTFWETMHAEAHEGRTIVFATHYLEEADEFAQRVVLLKDGSIVADGSASEIRALTGTKHLTMQITRDDAGWRECLDRHGFSFAVDGATLRVAADDSDAAAKILLDSPGLEGLEIRASSLEDTFVQLTSAEPALSR